MKSSNVDQNKFPRFHEAVQTLQTLTLIYQRMGRLYARHHVSRPAFVAYIRCLWGFMRRMGEFQKQMRRSYTEIEHFSRVETAKFDTDRTDNFSRPYGGATCAKMKLEVHVGDMRQIRLAQQMIALFNAMNTQGDLWCASTRSEVETVIMNYKGLKKVWNKLAYDVLSVVSVGFSLRNRDGGLPSMNPLWGWIAPNDIEFTASDRYDYRAQKPSLVHGREYRTPIREHRARWDFPRYHELVQTYNGFRPSAWKTNLAFTKLTTPRDQAVFARWLSSSTQIEPRRFRDAGADLRAVGMPSLVMERDGVRYFTVPVIQCHNYDDRYARGFALFADRTSEIFLLSSVSGVEESLEDFHTRRVLPAVNRELAYSRQREAEERTLKEREAKRKSNYAFILRTARRIPTITLRDSWDAGNCRPGTEDFVQVCGFPSDMQETTGKEVAKRWRAKNYYQPVLFSHAVLQAAARCGLITTDEATQKWEILR